MFKYVFTLSNLGETKMAETNYKDIQVKYACKQFY